MRILHVFDMFSLPHGGGTVDLVYKLSRAQVRRGHQVAVYTSDFELDQPYIDSLEGVRVHPFHCVSSIGGFYLVPNMISAVRDSLRDFDIVHLHCARSFQNLVIHHYAAKYGVPYIVDHHGSLLRSPGGQARAKSGLKWLYDVAFGYKTLKDAARLVTENEFGAREYERFGRKRDRITVIPLSFPVSDFAELPPRGNFLARYGIGDKKLVLFLGRLNHIKGLDFLIESFSQLCRSRNDAMLAIVGPDDGARGKLERLTAKRQLSGRVVFTGFLGGDDKLSAFVDADVFVQPSRYEMAAWAPVEAVLCGTPVVVTRGTGAAEDVSRMKAGYLVDYGDKGQMVSTIQAILDNPAEAREKASRAGTYIRENLQLSQMDDYERLYKQCIASPSRRKR